MAREYSHASSFLSVLSVSLLIDGCLTAGKIFWPPKKEKFTRGFWTNFIYYFWFPVPEQENLPGQARCVARGFARFNVLWFKGGREALHCAMWWLEVIIWIKSRKAFSQTSSVGPPDMKELSGSLAGSLAGPRLALFHPDMIWAKYRLSVYSPQLSSSLLQSGPLSLVEVLHYCAPIGRELP